jgi:hypothetical protein
VPQSDLVLLLVWVQDKANVYTGATNTNARAANGDTDATTLSSTAHIHTGTLTLSRTTHIHVAKPVEQLTDNILNAAPAQAVLPRALRLAFVLLS